MPALQNKPKPVDRLTLTEWSLPAKVLATFIIVMMGMGLVGALGQVVVHDVIPNFSSEKSADAGKTPPGAPEPAPPRGDLFLSVPVEPRPPPFYESDEFLFALKFTHIHIFGMSGIFIVMGVLVVFLDAGRTIRVWLVILPFIGVLMDLLSAWLKIFVDPAFFWLHIPGGVLFVTVFAVDALWMLRQMWRRRS